MTFKFEWDARKAASNRKKHGVSFEEALTVFNDPLELSFEDGRSRGELRHVTLGRSLNDHLLVVVSTERGDRVRIISARRASSRERYQYEENR